MNKNKETNKTKTLAQNISLYYDAESFDEDFTREDFEKHIYNVLVDKEQTEIKSLVEFFEKQAKNGDNIAKVLLVDTKEYLTD